MADKKLTAKQQELFDNLGSALRKETVTCYVQNGFENGKQAYLKACKNLNKKPSKNPETSASEILSYPNVREYLDSLLADSAKDNEITAEFVLKGIKDLTQRVEQSDSPAAAYKGYELLGKHLKLFTDKLEQDTNLTVVRKTYKVE